MFLSKGLEIICFQSNVLSSCWSMSELVNYCRRRENWRVIGNGYETNQRVAATKTRNISEKVCRVQRNEVARNKDIVGCVEAYQFIYSVIFQQHLHYFGRQFDTMMNHSAEIPHTSLKPDIGARNIIASRLSKYGAHAAVQADVRGCMTCHENWECEDEESESSEMCTKIIKWVPGGSFSCHVPLTSLRNPIVAAPQDERPHENDRKGSWEIWWQNWRKWWGKFGLSCMCSQKPGERKTLGKWTHQRSCTAHVVYPPIMTEYISCTTLDS